MLLSAVNFQNAHTFRSSTSVFSRRTVFFLACAAAVALAQHTDIQDAGSGRKTQADYDATGKVTQQRTVDADGRLLQKIEYEYWTGNSAPPPTVLRQTTTTYGFSGRVREVTRQTFDVNTNFTEELIQTFDDSGKQTGGHLLSHRPWNGTYACADWNAAAQAYKSVECPEGEESSGGAETVKKFSRQEAIEAIKMARSGLLRDKQAPKRVGIDADARAAAKSDVAVVLPAEAPAGARVSGIVTEDASRYDGIPEVTVSRIQLPLEPGEVAADLGAWNVEIAGESLQPADGPITFITPGRASDIRITLRPTVGARTPIAISVPAPRVIKRRKTQLHYKSAVLCLKGDSASSAAHSPETVERLSLRLKTAPLRS